MVNNLYHSSARVSKNNIDSWRYAAEIGGLYNIVRDGLVEGKIKQAVLINEDPCYSSAGATHLLVELVKNGQYAWLQRDITAVLSEGYKVSNLECVTDVGKCKTYPHLFLPVIDANHILKYEYVDVLSEDNFIAARIYRLTKYEKAKPKAKYKSAQIELSLDAEPRLLTKLIGIF